MMRSIITITICGLVLATPVVADISCEISFCQFEVPCKVKSGSFNFYVIYNLELDEDGKPAAITMLRNDYVLDDEVRACLASWKFEGFRKGAVVSVSFFWIHAVGWTRLAIKGPGFEQHINLTGDRSPYRPVEDANRTPTDG